MFRLTHAPSLNVFRDGAAGVPLKAGLELACTHAGDACKTIQRDVKGVMIGDIAHYITKPCNILFGKWVCIFCRLFFLIVHNKGDGIRYLGLIEKRRRHAFAPVVLYLKQQLGHGRKVCRLIDTLKRGGQIKVCVRMLLFQVILIIRRKHLDPDGMNGDTLMDDCLVILLSADNGLNTPSRQPPVRIQLLAGNGIISCNADAFGNIKIQDKVVVEIEIVNFNIKQVFLRIQPVVAAAERRVSCQLLPAGLNCSQFGIGVKVLSGKNGLYFFAQFPVHGYSLKQFDFSMQ